MGEVGGAGTRPPLNFWFHLNFNALFRIRDNGADQRHKRSVSSREGDNQLEKTSIYEKGQLLRQR